MAGRPLRASALALLLLAGFEAVRLPGLVGQWRTIVAQMTPRRASPVPAMLATAPAGAAGAAAAVMPAAVPARAPSRHLIAAVPATSARLARPAPARLPPLAEVQRHESPPLDLAPPATTPATTPATAAAGPPAALAATLAAPATPAFDLATRAYASLAAGDRRAAAALFDAALRRDPGNTAWRHQRALLGRRFSGSAFTLLRDGGPTGPTAAPVLGGGQTGAVLAFTPDPLQRRPLALVARVNAALRPDQTPDVATTQAALGLRWTLLPGASISAERLVGLGAAASDHWTLRLAAGGTRGRLSGYGEAGVLDNGDLYAGGQARAEIAARGPERRRIAAGVGAWAGAQTGAMTLGRVDAGPSLSARLGAVTVQADWRFRLAGNAAPASGPVLTVSSAF